MSERTDSREKLWELIRETRFAMFTTRHSNGHLHSRPMTTQNRKIDEDDTIWFFMPRSGDPVADIAADRVVNVVYADPGADAYVSVSGNAELVEDPAKKQALWSKLNEGWFPKGPSDPELALVAVRIVHAHYWDVASSKLVQLYAMAKAALTGKPPAHLGETGEVRMR